MFCLHATCFMASCFAAFVTLNIMKGQCSMRRLVASRAPAAVVFRETKKKHGDEEDVRKRVVDEAAGIEVKDR